MSNRQQDPIDGCLTAVFSIIWFATAGLIMLVVRLFRPSPEEQLRRVQARGRQTCPKCRAINTNNARNCLSCGKHLKNR